MTYLMTHFWPGATEEQYRATLAAVHPDGELPQGQLQHAAGVNDDGVLIAALRDSKESADRFTSEVLMPAMPVEGGVEGEPEAKSAEVVNQQAA